ncbi:MAG: hypothetical protein VB055_03455 [Oscillospiraceae bacterium]|nr:hypothetical protein [Oscillospiraceae bacterium]
MMIQAEILDRYHMQPLSWYKERHGDTAATEAGFYRTFLQQTDYIPAKIMEAQFAGKTLDEDYSAVLQGREEAREILDGLQAPTEGGGSG